jgi:hypothetical protein
MMSRYAVSGLTAMLRDYSDLPCSPIDDNTKCSIGNGIVRKGRKRVRLGDKRLWAGHKVHDFPKPHKREGQMEPRMQKAGVGHWGAGVRMPWLASWFGIRVEDAELERRRSI